jgi:hypothetical protein
VATFLIVAATVVVAIVAATDDVLLVLPPLMLGMQSRLFQQYADLTVIGAAGAVLERRIAVALGAHALIYEMAVAPIRKRSRSSAAFASCNR